MIELPEGARGRALALGVAVAALLLFYLVAVAPMVGLYMREQGRVDERLALAARVTAAAADLPRLRAATNGQAKAEDRDNFALAGTSDTIAVATLQTQLKSLADAAGAKLTNVEILPPEPAQPFSRVVVRTNFTADYRTLVALIAGIEKSRPALFVDRIEVRADERAKVDATPPMLAVTLDVYGLRVSS